MTERIIVLIADDTLTWHKATTEGIAGGAHAFN